MKDLDVSIVIPVFNETENIMPLYHALQSAMREVSQTWEVIFIDDGSTDTTYRALEQLHAQDESVQVIRLRRNFGQTAAMAAGLDHARGEIIVTMDGDLQNDPADIPLLISKLEEGYDLACGWRVNRQDSLSRRLSSKIANKLISVTTGLYLHDYGCTLKALRREIADELKLYGEMHRFIPALAASLGASIIEVPVRHHPREHGRSKYGLGRTIRVLLDLMTVKFLSGYFTRPSHLFGLCGIITLFLGSGITIVLGLQRVFGKTGLFNRPLLLLGILLTIIGTQFITVGLLGEMLARIYHESQEKPVYAIREILRSESRELTAVNSRSAKRAVSLQVKRALHEVLTEPPKFSR
jgi:glycosyltransferase involved in cell wall biosynthesis